MDLDDLKQVNTDHGHYMGSKVLRDVATRLITSVRSIDKVFRYGGDEFCVVLPETDSQGAYHVAERVRTQINGKKFELTNREKITMTGSFGIASYPLHASTKEELVNFADKAVYKVKTSTKDSVLIAATDMEDKS
jgi:diguanylate cyclase (GGDEF)-like protein